MKHSFVNKLKARPCKVCYCSSESAFQPTQNGLALTPSDVKRCVDSGIPVTTANANMFIEGVENPSTNLPVDELRGCDIVDAWEASRSAKSKLVRAHLNDVNIYGK